MNPLKLDAGSMERNRDQRGTLEKVQIQSHKCNNIDFIAGNFDEEVDSNGHKQASIPLSAFKAPAPSLLHSTVKRKRRVSKNLSMPKQSVPTL